MTAEASKAHVRNVSPQAPPQNAVHELREELGLSKVDLARLANLSEKTIARIERRIQGFRAVTYRRVLIGLNKARRHGGKTELSYQDVFPA